MVTAKLDGMFLSKGISPSSVHLTNTLYRPFFTVCFIVGSCLLDCCLEEQTKISNASVVAALDSTCYAQVQGKLSASTRHIALAQLLTICRRSNATHADLLKIYGRSILI